MGIGEEGLHGTFVLASNQQQGALMHQRHAAGESGCLGLHELLQRAVREHLKDADAVDLPAVRHVDRAAIRGDGDLRGLGPLALGSLGQGRVARQPRKPAPVLAVGGDGAGKLVHHVDQREAGVLHQVPRPVSWLGLRAVQLAEAPVWAHGVCEDAVLAEVARIAQAAPCGDEGVGMGRVLPAVHPGRPAVRNNVLWRECAVRANAEGRNRSARALLAVVRPMIVRNQQGMSVLCDRCKDGVHTT
mmetsp:Transcript_1390/g.4205  ORF Transcript_1390/g.4205 Transcript_1390/m.4205 type:complete len:245 (+) Transcript_1390:391-1125(+)